MHLDSLEEGGLFSQRVFDVTNRVSQLYSVSIPFDS